MGHAIFDFLRSFIAEYGYWAIALALFCENAGLPVPGETTLLLASIMAHSDQRLSLTWIVVVGTCAATLGDNLGYVIGYRGGRRLLEHYQRTLRVSPDALARGEKLFARYGSATILVARFIFGMRIIAGPLAGVLRMRWRSFAVFNLLGALLWVWVITTVGYLFGQHLDKLEGIIKRFDVGVALIVIVFALFWWVRLRRQRVAIKT